MRFRRLRCSVKTCGIRRRYFSGILAVLAIAGWDRQMIGHSIIVFLAAITQATGVRSGLPVRITHVVRHKHTS
jgi:hypothetical protein